MKLRSQLIVISLLVLLLPLSGWQLVRSLESSLREGYQQTLIDTATATARGLADAAAAWTTDDGLYVHLTDLEFHLDGHAGEWEPWLDQQQPLDTTGISQTVHVIAARNRERLFVLLNADDDHLVFAEPGRGPGDRVELQLHFAEGTERVTLAPLAPGWLEAGSSGGRARIQGTWQPRERGWMLELRVAGPTPPERIGITVTDVDDPGQRAVAGRAAFAEPRPLVSRSPAIGDQLAQLSPDNVRAWIVNPAGWVIASADRRGDRAPSTAGRVSDAWLVTELSGQLLGRALQDGQYRDRYTARLHGPEIAHEPSAAWVQQAGAGDLTIVAGAPIRAAGQLRGHVVIEREADQFVVLAYRSVLKLFGLGLGGIVLVTLILIGFAVVLSERIRRLRDAAEHAVAPDGRVRAPLSADRGSDEIGDLGRSLAGMVARQQQHQQYLQTLAGKLSHELRTPLAMIRSSLDNLSQVEDDASRQRYQQRAEEGCRRLQHTLQAMSQAARIEQSLPDEPLETVDLATLVVDYVDGCRNTFTRHRFAAVVPKAGKACVRGSVELLAQLLDKLIENAVDFTPEDGQITVRVVPMRDEVSLQVDNPGSRLPEERSGQLFESMVSARPGSDRARHLGLGLHIARLLAEHHGGRIRAVNLTGGCRFQVDLPQSRNQEPP